MIVLALDTSTPSTAVGLSLADDTVIVAYDHRAAGERPGHQDRLLTLAAGLLGRASIDWRDIDRIAVGTGPGTYTGLRVGLASARALAQSLDAEIVGISSLMSLAYAAFRAGLAPRALTIVDARRRELFVAAYERQVAPSMAYDCRPALLCSPRAISAQALGGLLDELPLNAPGGSLPTGARQEMPAAWVGVGNALRATSAVNRNSNGKAANAIVADVVADVLRTAGVHVPSESSPRHGIDASALCELARCTPAQSLASVVPEYCRPADAEIALQASSAA